MATTEEQRGARYSELGSRFSRLDPRGLDPPPRLILNPHAGRKLGLPTNLSTLSAVQHALETAGLRFDVRQTHARKEATVLAKQAVQDGCRLVIAAGGDGTVAEAAEGLVNTQAALGIMPLGSVMNVARTLCIPRDLAGAARTIAEGQVLAIDVGLASNHIFLEAGGVGLAAGLFGYFNRLDSERSHARAVLMAMWRYIRHLRIPRLIIEADGEHFEVSAPQVTVSNSPYVGAAYVLAPEARVDDGLLDVVIFRGMSPWRVLLHMALVTGGHRLPPPPGVQLVRARSVTVASRRRRHPPPVHADGEVVGVTPAHFEVVPGGLRVVIGNPVGPCAWGPALRA